MAIQTKTVEVQGVTGLTTAFGAKRNNAATGTASSITPTEVAGTGIYTVDVNWDDVSAANEPLGKWAISLGDVTGYLGRSIVTFTADEDTYSLGSGGGTSDAPSPQEIAAELEREAGPLYKLYRKFDGIDKIIKWLRK